MQRSILHLIEGFREGGSERQAVQQARLLHGTGSYHIHVACLNGEGVLRAEVERLGLGRIPEYPLTGFYDRNAVMQVRRFAHYLREHKIDVVQTHDFYTNIFGMAAAALARVPVRIAARRETTGTRTWTQKRVEHIAYNFAHAIVANAEAVREQLVRENVRARKIEVIHNGLDIRRVTPQATAKRDAVLAGFGLPCEASRRFVTIVANLRLGVKDHPTFLRAAQRVYERMPGAAFVIAGEGPLTESVRALAVQLGLGSATFFTGRCDRVAELLAVSDVCVLSSRAEGFSNSILEYMAARRPVVVTDVGGAREMVEDGETGYLVQAGDDQTMAARIISLLDEPERAREMGERGRRVVEDRFSCAAQLRRIQELYDRLLARATQPLRQNVKAMRYDDQAKDSSAEMN